jgi:hypothetical protein
MAIKGLVDDSGRCICLLVYLSLLASFFDYFVAKFKSMKIKPCFTNASLYSF